jgi:hypothetical protein
LGAVKEHVVAPGSRLSDIAVVKEHSNKISGCVKLFAIELTFPINCGMSMSNVDHAVTNIDRRTLSPIEFCSITL